MVVVVRSMLVWEILHMVRPVVAVSETALHYHCRSTTMAHSAGFLVGNGNALLSLCAAASLQNMFCHTIQIFSQSLVSL